MSLERKVVDMLMDGTITDKDAEAIRNFSEFLKFAGPADGSTADRLKAAGRQDLLDWALGISVQECTGRDNCSATVHIHGCYADKGISV